MSHFLRICFWPVFFLTHFLVMALLAWHLVAQIHFAYPIGYRLLGLEQHIAEYAPLNRYKKDFESTTKEDHWRLFGEISDAVQNSGHGLRNISYKTSNGKLTALMHEAEIIHLQDVANLIDVFYLTGIGAGIIWLCLLIVARVYTLALPSLHRVSLGFLGTLLSISVLVLLIGATKIFYWLHTKIFPENHQWFFYYQDSLMTTLMKAPDIFAFITLVLLILLIICWGFSYWIMTRFLTNQPAKPIKKDSAKIKKKRK